MKLSFVRVDAGGRKIHWAGFLAFSALLLVIAAAVAEALAYLIKGSSTFGGLVLAETVVLLFLARVLIRVLASQSVEIEDVEQS